MPKIFLNNGKTLNLSNIPVKNEYYYIATDKWDEIISSIVKILEIDNSKIAKSKESISDILTENGDEFYISGDNRGILISRNNSYEYFEEKDDIPKDREWG